MQAINHMKKMEKSKNLFRIKSSHGMSLNSSIKDNNDKDNNDNNKDNNNDADNQNKNKIQNNSNNNNNKIKSDRNNYKFRLTYDE